MADFDLRSTAVPTGRSVIEASAGTGKTWTIAHLVPRLLVDGVVESIGELLLVTFTEDAARELGERTRRQLAALVAYAAAGAPPGERDRGVGILLERLDALDAGEREKAVLRLRLALDETDQLAVSTIHSFCRQVLAAESFLCGMPAGFEILPDPDELLADAVKDAWRTDLAADPLLAALAAVGGWSVEEDLESWRKLTQRPSTRMEPPPRTLQDARGQVEQALRNARNARGDIDRLQEIAGRNGVRLNNSKQNPGKDSVARLDDWRARLDGLDPRQPPLEIFAVFERLRGAANWFNQANEVGKTAAADAHALPLAAAARAAETGICATSWAWLAHLDRTARKRFERSLRRRNAVTYDGLIEHVHRALCAGPNRAALARRLSEKWTVGLVDESQDADRQQLDIFRAIFDNDAGRLILVGDPKQAIYGFRGGDLQAYLSARPADDARVSNLATTYRSAHGLVTALNTLFGRGRAFGNPELAYPEATAAQGDDELPLPDDGQGRLVAWVVPDSAASEWSRAPSSRKRAAACTASAIVDLLDRTMGSGADGRPPQTVKPSHVAVLTRTNNEATLVYEALRERNVPAVVRGEGDVMQSDTAADLAAVLTAVLAPAHPGRRAAALATCLLGYDSAMLDALSDAEAEEWMVRFSEWGAVWRSRGIAALMARLEAHVGNTLRQVRVSASERRLTDLRHLMELLQGREADGWRAPESLLQWFEGERASENRNTDERLRRLDEDGAAVQVVTVHRAKGLEFDFVFCPYLWSMRPDVRVYERLLVRRGEGWVLADGAQQDNQDAHRAATAERLREDLRLAYVALTRAGRRVTLLAGPVGNVRRTPPTSLDWLLRTSENTPSVEAWYAAMAADKRGGEVCEHGATLRSLRAACPDVLTVTEPYPPLETAWTPGDPGAADLRARPAPALDLDAWRLTSFSRLAHGRDEDRERHDAVAKPAAAGAAGASGEADEELGAEVLLADFARGTHAGTCLHDLLERWDFREDAAGLVERILRRHRLHTAEAVDAVRRALDVLQAARLDSLDADLAAAAADPSLSEWEFLLPLGPAGITGQRLSALFARHARSDEERGYARDLAGLPGQALSGMLTGYIDRLVRAADRWGVVDWKSNYLGPRLADYSRPALWRCAAREHYLLQVHLYLVALRRYLRLHDPGANAASGSLLFLRGARPGTSHGALEITPPDALLDDLDRLFAGPARKAAA